jgi:hypothetical protein
LSSLNLSSQSSLKFSRLPFLMERPSTSVRMHLCLEETHTLLPSTNKNPIIKILPLLPPLTAALFPLAVLSYLLQPLTQA